MVSASSNFYNMSVLFQTNDQNADASVNSTKTYQTSIYYNIVLEQIWLSRFK